MCVDMFLATNPICGEMDCAIFIKSLLVYPFIRIVSSKLCNVNRIVLVKVSFRNSSFKLAIRKGYRPNQNRSCVLHSFHLKHFCCCLETKFECKPLRFGDWGCLPSFRFKLQIGRILKTNSFIN